MGFCRSIVLVLAVVGSAFAFTAEYIPKSYYVIHDGEQSPTVFLRDRRSLQNLVPLVRMRRSDSGHGNSNSGAGSYSSSGSFAGSGAGGAQDAVYFADNLAAVMKLAGFPNGVPGFPGAAQAGFGGAAGGVPGAAHAGFHSGGGAGGVGGYGNGLSTPDLHSRFGGGDDGISYSGSAEGAKGVYSASSSSIDGDGNVKYSVKTGKF